MKFPPLPIVDMLYQRQRQPLAPILGRTNELSRMARTIARRPYNNLLLVGKRGTGKSSLIQALAQAVNDQTFPALPSLPYLQLQTAAIAQKLRSAAGEAVSEYLSQAFHHLPACVFVIDDAERLLDLLPNAAAFDRVFSAFTTTVSRRVIIVLEEEKISHFQETFERSLKTFDTLLVPELSDATNQAIVLQRAPLIATSHTVTIIPESLSSIYDGSKKIVSPRSQPDRALRLLDEICAAAALTVDKKVTQEVVEMVLAQRLNVPTRALNAQRQKQLKQLPQRLKEQVIGQDMATDLVAGVIQRAALGLKNPHRPIGSFLFLGPSGVGKTELAKVLAKEFYGTDRAFTRLDMSEFADAHTAARLTGAPPGYVGYEAGGQLTNPVLEQPFSLILLDEIEKAHPSIFDLFLQVLDDGRLTDGQGRLVDFSQTIIIATSNIGIRDIVRSYQAGHRVASPQFLQATMMPLLQNRFRLEFLNRFEGMAVFEPLSQARLMDIARLEIQKIETRLAHHHVTISVSDEELRQIIQSVADPHLGARPLKRFIEQRCEAALADRLLQTAL